MRRFPFHPVLFAAFPVLFLFVENAERVRLGKVTGPLILILAATVVVTAVVAFAFRSLRRGALVSSGLVLLGLSYGHIWTAVQDDAIAGIVVGRDMFLLPLWALLGLGVVLFAWRLKALGEVTAIVNVVAAGLLIVSAINTSSAVASQSGRAFQANPGRLSEEIPLARGDVTKRDVFYLIFDRYGSKPVLEKYVGYDNSKFLDALEERGFFVADGSQSNYPTTAHSVASSLNMEYLNDLAKRVGEKSDDWKPLYRTIPGSKVSHFLQEQGYQYAHIGPWYDPTASDKTAQVNYHYDKTSEFTRVLLQTTIVEPLAKRIGFLREFDGRQVAHNQKLFQFESILDAAKLPGPWYTFAHILLPHEPFSFEADGSYKSRDVQETEPYEVSYIDQIEYGNRRILGVVDELLDVPDEEKPIIVLQSDEGPKRAEWQYGGEERWEDASAADLEQKVGILNALYLPGGPEIRERAALYDDITPVNTFRRIFNVYFGTNLAPLPDRIHVYGNEKEPYRLTDVTDRVR